jgi:hypothetical protein
VTDPFDEITWEVIREQIKSSFGQMSELLAELVADLIGQGWSEPLAREIVVLTLRGGATH